MDRQIDKQTDGQTNSADYRTPTRRLSPALVTSPYIMHTAEVNGSAAAAAVL